jgi:hypothetical protein
MLQTASSQRPAYAAGPIGDPEGVHRRLAHWNRRRLAPGAPSPRWEEELDEDRQMLWLEGAWIEHLREGIWRECAALPRSPEGFIAWFRDLLHTGPGQDDPLFDWLAGDADEDGMKWFLTQEAAGEAGFDDLVAFAQVKLPDLAKLELARNYWDEMGRGNEHGMHGRLLEAAVRELRLQPDIDDTVWPSLALANTLVALCTTRRYAWHAVGALGVVELTAPSRVSRVGAGLKRLGFPPVVRKYFDLHAVLDLKHADDWIANALHPLVEEDPDRAPFIAEGALMRLGCGRRCFDDYRRHLWSRPPMSWAAE